MAEREQGSPKRVCGFQRKKDCIYLEKECTLDPHKPGRFN